MLDKRFQFLDDHIKRYSWCYNMCNTCVINLQLLIKNLDIMLYLKSSKVIIDSTPSMGKCRNEILVYFLIKSWDARYRAISIFGWRSTSPQQIQADFPQHGPIFFERSLVEVPICHRRRLASLYFPQQRLGRFDKNNGNGDVSKNPNKDDDDEHDVAAVDALPPNKK